MCPISSKPYYFEHKVNLSVFNFGNTEIISVTFTPTAISSIAFTHIDGIDKSLYKCLCTVIPKAVLHNLAHSHHCWATVLGKGTYQNIMLTVITFILLAIICNGRKVLSHRFSKYFKM